MLPPLSPVFEKSLLNDTGVGLGDSIGAVIDTDAETSKESFAVSAEEDESTGKEWTGNETESQSKIESGKKKTKSKKKIHRPCPFCGVLQSVLTRHITLKHKKESSVIKALALPSHERIKAFDNFKKVGIFQLQ